MFQESETEGKRTKSPLMLDRRAQIAELVRQRGAMRVEDLADMFQVSLVTIRSDLAQLEKEGMLTRDRGGAVPTVHGSALIAFDTRTGLHLEEKRRIGQAAARLVVPGDTILMDAGTTVVEMTRHLHQVAPLNVVTNALNVAVEMGALPAVQVLLLGGMINYATYSTLGPLVEQSLNDLVVRKLFLAAESVDASIGVMDTTMEIAQVKRVMVQAARRVILLADSSKWQRTGFIKVTPLNTIDTIITDKGLSHADRAAIERLGVELILV
ncbi:MAG: DeoR/GlpR family DNA-binding transcription regulator [Chloroflexales bacterium]|nr:DeoR/GlpR family DNA-binding transcription regulator [Chloroflexales bacterium]